MQKRNSVLNGENLRNALLLLFGNAYKPAYPQWAFLLKQLVLFSEELKYAVALP